MVNGRLLRTDKQFRHLKQRQRETISQWLYEGYRRCWLKAGHEPLPRDTGKIVAAVMEKIEAAGIWIPEQEVRQYFSRKKSHSKTESRGNWTVLQTHPPKAQKAEKLSALFCYPRFQSSKFGFALFSFQ